MRAAARLAAAGAAAAILLAPGRAEAHLVTTGLGPVYDGIGHFLVTPEDLVAVIALALLAGLRGPAGGRRVLVVLPLAWLAGGIAGTPWGTEAGFPVAALTFLALGALVAADAAVPPAALAGLAAALGLLHGWGNGAALRAGGRGALGLLGIAAAVLVLAALAAALVVSLRRPWARVAVRVAGSWIAATGLLLLGWAIGGKG